MFLILFAIKGLPPGIQRFDYRVEARWVDVYNVESS
jgi:hypothetical protein